MNEKLKDVNHQWILQIDALIKKISQTNSSHLSKEQLSGVKELLDDQLNNSKIVLRALDDYKASATRLAADLLAIDAHFEERTDAAKDDVEGHSNWLFATEDLRTHITILNSGLLLSETLRVRVGAIESGLQASQQWLNSARNSQLLTRETRDLDAYRALLSPVAEPIALPPKNPNDLY